MLALLLISVALPSGADQIYPRAGEWPAHVLLASDGKYQCETYVTLSRGQVDAVQTGDLIVIQGEVRGAVTRVDTKVSRGVIAWPKERFGPKVKVAIRPAGLVSAELEAVAPSTGRLDVGSVHGVREGDDVYQGGRHVGKVVSPGREVSLVDAKVRGAVFVHITGDPTPPKKKAQSRSSLHVEGVVRVAPDKRQRKPNFDWTTGHDRKLATESDACKAGFTDSCLRALGLNRAKSGQPTLSGKGPVHRWQCKERCPYRMRCQPTPSPYL